MFSFQSLNLCQQITFCTRKGSSGVDRGWEVVELLLRARSGTLQTGLQKNLGAAQDAQAFWLSKLWWDKRKEEYIWTQRICDTAFDTLLPSCVNIYLYILFIFSVCACICTCVCACVSVCVCVWVCMCVSMCRLEATLRGSVFSLYHVGLWEWMRVVRHMP